MILEAISLLSMASLSTQQEPYEFRAAWVATVDNIDWPSKPGLSVAQMKAELDRIVETAERIRLNALVFQVRTSADALYKSDLEPWSWFLTGEQGKAPAGGFDPLEYVVDKAHRHGLELHAWFNPYRAGHPAQDGPFHRSHLSNTDPGIVKQVGDYKWMDPGEPKVQQRSLEVMFDVVERYDIDGVHIDDYFYPYPSYNGGNDFPDEASWSRYRSSGGTLGKSDWRRKNVDDFVQDLYEGIKERKKWVKFGISPFGIYRPGHPEGIEAGIDQYEALYADARKWLVEGWCDYYTPQLYWPIDQKPQSYPVLLGWWIQQNPKGRHVWPGNFSSRLNPSGGDWPAKELLDQIRITQGSFTATGNVHFSMKTFLIDWKGINAKLMNSVYGKRALIPPSVWLDPYEPAAPDARYDNGRIRVKSSDSDLRFWAVYYRANGGWQLGRVFGSEMSELPLVEGRGSGAYAVAAIDRAGNRSPLSVAN